MSDTKKSYYKYCIVPLCTNTTANSPSKIFFSVPKVPALRKNWTNAMKRDEKLNPKLSSKSSLWCCEDHFSLEEDMENYWQWKLAGSVKQLLLKPDVLPHIFHCQKQPTSIKRNAAKKRNHSSILADAMQSTESVSEIEEGASIETNDVSSSLMTTDKCMQVNLKNTYRSKATNTNVCLTSVATSPIKMNSDVGTSISPKKLKKIESQNANDSKYSSDASSSDFECHDESSEDFDSEEGNFQNDEFKDYMRKGTLMSIEKDPKLYLGLPKRVFFLVKLLSEKTSAPTLHLYVVLKKLRLNNPFSILSVEFGLSKSSICRIFKKTLVLIAQYMQELIIWPENKEIFSHMPIPFRARYGKVISIIDCLEIEIEKPGNPIQQSLTWSNYYQCNTMKYLISCTPDGLVSFISDGYGGRASDFLITEKSGYLQNLTPGSYIMADRGFKNISVLLTQKACTLVRPPSVSSSIKISKDDVKQSKQIAALRIHVERVIGRLREFKMLLPHACIDNHLVPILDYAIITACGIINMHNHLIKKQV